MRILDLVATALAATLILCGCAPSTTHSVASPSPSPTTSTPAFLLTVQSENDRLPDGVAATVDVGTTSSRYQGEWDGHEIYLAVTKSSSVCLVTGIQNSAHSWVAGCGDGNEVVSWTFADGGMVKYLPMASSVTPQGWTRLSDYVFAM